MRYWKLSPLIIDGVGPTWMKRLCTTGRNSSSLWRSPGQVVMGGDSCSQSCGFESELHTLDGYFSHIIL